MLAMVPSATHGALSEDAPAHSVHESWSWETNAPVDMVLLRRWWAAGDACIVRRWGKAERRGSRRRKRTLNNQSNVTSTRLLEKPQKARRTCAEDVERLEQAAKETEFL